METFDDVAHGMSGCRELNDATDGRETGRHKVRRRNLFSLFQNNFLMSPYQER